MTRSIRLLCLLLLIASPGWGQATAYNLLERGQDEIRQLEDDLLPFDEFKRRVDLLALQKSNYPVALRGRITQLQCWAYTIRDLERYDQAIEFARQQLELAQHAGDMQTKTGLMICLSWYQQRQGKNDEALRGYEQALELATALGDVRRQAKAHGYLGGLLSAQGNMLEAMRHLQASLDLYKSIGLEDRDLHLQVSMANLYRQLGIYEQAEQLLKKLSDIYQARDEAEWLTTIRVYQGILYTETNENDKAIGLLSQAEQYYEDKQRPMEVAEVRLYRAFALLQRDRIEEAWDKLQQVNDSIAAGERLEPMLLALRDMLMGIVLNKRGDHQLALNHLDAAITVLQEGDSQKQLGYAYRVKSLVLKEMGLYQASLQALEQFIEIDHRVEDALRDRRIMQVQLERELTHQAMKNEQLESERKLEQQTSELSRERRQWQRLILALLLGGLLFYLVKRIIALRTLSITDELTSLLNRRQILMQAQMMLQHSQHSRAPFSLLMLDIDHFKRVNDTLGHNMGDVVLIEVAQCISRTLRAEDVVGRNGGEEFLVLLPNTDMAAAARVAERIRTQVAALQIEDVTNVLDIRVSIGVAQYHLEDSSLSALVHRADLAMYQAKRQGRNRVVMAS
ncbi:diguanylate cyclase [Aeromonas encheleia]|uniref:diguanylate cyclase n=1 Tax=Aeromonas encheleia TaxID=73010 RepID=UPI001F566345|nr:diguanylate cyclase [Aeromonas encheleia]UNP87934.1 diguanylate cyclase [Aeromonas encheleia]